MTKDFPKTKYSNPDGELPRALAELNPQPIHVSNSDQQPIFFYRYIPSAPEYAIGPFQPIMYAKALIPDLNWIQIVRIDKDPEITEGRDLRIWWTDTSWELVDSTPAQRLSGRPFYSEHCSDEFWDNPCYWGPDPYLYRRTWLASLFAVSTVGSRILFHAGISWGFKTLPSRQIVPLETAKLTRESWNTCRDKIKPLYPTWSFE